MATKPSEGAMRRATAIVTDFLGLTMHTGQMIEEIALAIDSAVDAENEACALVVENARVPVNILGEKVGVWDVWDANPAHLAGAIRARRKARRDG